MFELTQLEQLLAIQEYKTLSAAAEHLHLFQPALSRSMQRLEEELSVTLFERQKNKLTFNEDGQMALEYADRIMDLSQEMKTALQSAARARRTISIGSLAPASLWTLVPEVSRLHPDIIIQSEMADQEHLAQGLLDNTYQIIVTNDPTVEDDIELMEYCEEDLYVVLPPAHPLAGRNAVSLSDLNGQSILQYAKVGFWLDLCKAKMPDSKFLIQDEMEVLMEVLDELRKNSALPAFATNITGNVPAVEHRVMLPITDDEVNVIFYLKYKKANRKLFKDISALA